jgi:hypothetical protein
MRLVIALLRHRLSVTPTTSGALPDGTDRSGNGSWQDDHREDFHMAQPVRYAPSVETIEADEAETIRALEEQFRIILDTTSQDYGHAVRSVHAKGHGIAKGTLSVADNLPPELSQGLFAQPGTYEAILRISTNAGDILDDAIALPRGIALKILGVEGARLPGSERAKTQDFLMVNGPAFAAPNPKKFLGNLKLLAKTTDKAEGAKKALSAVLRSFEAAGGRWRLKLDVAIARRGQARSSLRRDLFHPDAISLRRLYREVSARPDLFDQGLCHRDRQCRGPTRCHSRKCERSADRRWRHVGLARAALHRFGSDAD